MVCVCVCVLICILVVPQQEQEGHAVLHHRCHSDDVPAWRHQRRHQRHSVASPGERHEATTRHTSALITDIKGELERKIKTETESVWLVSPKVCELDCERRRCDGLEGEMDAADWLKKTTRNRGKSLEVLCSLLYSDLLVKCFGTLLLAAFITSLKRPGGKW